MFALKRPGVLAIQASCLAALVLGIVWNVRFAVADLLARRNQPERTRLAMRWMPVNGAYPAQLAGEIYALDPPSAKSLLQRAVQLNRYDASSWIQLGLLSEAGNDLPGAEKALLQAAKRGYHLSSQLVAGKFLFSPGEPCAFLVLGAKGCPNGSGRRGALVSPGLVCQSKRWGDRQPPANKKAGARRPVREFSHGSGRSKGSGRGGIAFAGGKAVRATRKPCWGSATG